MYRWYCGQCRTAIGNTLSPGMPFVGLIHTFMDHERDGRTRDEALGKPRAYTQAKFARGTPPASTTGLALLRIIVRSVRTAGPWRITGAGSPSPFVDDRTRAPRVQPRVLRPDERAAL